MEKDNGLQVGMSKSTVSEHTPQQSVQGMTQTARHLRAYIDRIERLEEDKKAIMEDMKDVFLEAKGDGFDVKAMRKIISIRKKDAAERAEEEAIIETYMVALGMQ